MPDFPADFQAAVDDLIDHWEGTKYTETPGDAGGGTKFGISHTTYPDVDIPNLTRADAEEIYYRDYWCYPGMDAIPDEALKAKVFNMGVLMGQATALRLVYACNNLDEYRQLCKQHFDAIIAKHPQDEKFRHGWERRALA